MWLIHQCNFLQLMQFKCDLSSRKYSKTKNTDSKQKKRKTQETKNENWAKQRVKAIFPKKKERKKSNPTVTLLCIFGAWYSALFLPKPWLLLKHSTTRTKIFLLRFCSDHLCFSSCMKSDPLSINMPPQPLNMRIFFSNSFSLYRLVL